MFEARQADQVDVVARPLPPFGFGHACHFKAELDVAESGAPREKLEGLEDHAAAATGGTGDVVAVQEDGATIAVVDAVDDAQESRLAASGGAEPHQELEPRHHEPEVLQDLPQTGKASGRKRG